MPDTFSPELHGWVLQTGYTLQPLFAVAEDRRELGNVRSIAIADRVLRRFQGLRWRGYGRAAAGYVQEFFRRLQGPAGRFYWRLPELLPDPDAAPVLTSAAGGSQGARDVLVSFAWRNAQGTTLPSPVAALAVPASELLTVSLEVFPPGSVDAVIYATEGAAGSECQQTVTGLQRWTQPNAPLLLLTAEPASSNTATETIVAKIVDTYSLTRLVGLTYELAIEIEEAYL